MTHTVITSFTEEGYERYGKEFIRTFREHWPESVRLVVYYEGDEVFRRLNGWEDWRDYWGIEGKRNSAHPKKTGHMARKASYLKGYIRVKR